MTANEVAVPEVEVLDELNVRNWYKTEGEDVEPIDNTQSQLEDLLHILQADTIDGILKRTEVVDAKSLAGETIQVLGYTRLPSTKADSALRFYLLIDCVDHNGEMLKVTCGSAKVMARIMSLRAHGFLPCYGAIVVATRPTAAGNYPMDFEGRDSKTMKKPGKGKGDDF